MKLPDDSNAKLPARWYNRFLKITGEQTPFLLYAGNRVDIIGSFNHCRTSFTESDSSDDSFLDKLLGFSHPNFELRDRARNYSMEIVQVNALNSQTSHRC